MAHHLLLETLDGVDNDSFKRFKWHLTHEVLDSCQPIAKAHLQEHVDRTDTVSKVIESYGEEMAVKITVEILRKMQNNYAAEKLRDKYAEKLKPASSSSDGEDPPLPSQAPTTSVSAADGAVIFSPIINAGHPGTWNVNIHNQK